MPEPLTARLRHLANLLEARHEATSDLLRSAANEIDRLEHELRYRPPAVSRILLKSFTAAAIDRNRDANRPDSSEAIARAVVKNASDKGLIRLKDHAE